MPGKYFEKREYFYLFPKLVAIKHKYEMIVAKVNIFLSYFRKKEEKKCKEEIKIKWLGETSW